MVAVRVYARATLEKALSVYKCKFLRSLDGRAELWETGWGLGFTLYNDQGYYDEWQYRQVILLISQNLPEDWFDKNGNGR